MDRKKRVPKTSGERLRECETHIYFLWDARRLYPKERDRFKQIAAELRVLVCRTRLNKPLLLDLMDEYAFAYDVQPPGKDPGEPPLKLQPLATVGWREDPAHQRISEALSSGDPDRVASAEIELAALAKPLPFREWVDRGLTVYIAPHDYSNRDLVLAIAQQYGSSHEDDSVEEPILRLREFIIGGHTGDVAPLIAFADSVIRVGQLFLEHLVGQHGYQPQHFKVNAI
jgi:hypothetical protein